jgi:hypothetical protein
MVHEKKIERLAEQQQKEIAHGDPDKLKVSRSLKIARGGLTTGFDTINLLTATITDVLEEGITTNQANVVVNAVGKVLKVVELQFKYGKPRPDGARERDLVLIGGEAAQA